MSLLIPNSRPSYIYVFYTRARESGHCLDFPANCLNRGSRGFTPMRWQLMAS